MRLALYQPDIPQNTGTLLRMAACLAVPVDIIEPAGFDTTDRALRRAGLDYLEHVELRRHASFAAFLDRSTREGLRLVLLSARGATPHLQHAFEDRDILMLGRESAGVPDRVREAAAVSLRIPMRAGLRSLNIAVAGAIVIGEALRQTGGMARLELSRPAGVE